MAVVIDPRVINLGDQVMVTGTYAAGDTTIELGEHMRIVDMCSITLPISTSTPVTTMTTDAGTANVPTVDGCYTTNAASTTITLYGGATGTATVTAADGDAAHGLTAGQKVTITSTNGTIKDYFVSDTNDGGVAHLGAVTAGATLKSTGSITASLTAGATGVSVGFNLSSGTQNAYLVLLKAAIEHSNGHAGKIIVSAVPTEANGAQSITLTQSTLASDGTSGNATITENLATVSASGFTGTGATAAGKFIAIGRRG